MKTLTQTATFRKRKSLGTRGTELSCGAASLSPLNTLISLFKNCFSFLFFLSIYEKLIQFCQIDELGTNYPNDMFDPHGWSEDSYYEALGKWCYYLLLTLTTVWLKLTGVFIFAAKAQKVEMDKLEKAKKERTKVSPTKNAKKRSMSRLCLCNGHVSPSHTLLLRLHR